MAGEAEAVSIPWDFLDWVAGWNVYGLPTVLLVTTIVTYSRSTETSKVPSRGHVRSDRAIRATIRMVSLLHVTLGMWAVFGLVREILTLRGQGIPQSNPVTGFAIPLIAVPMNLAIGHGLWRYRPWGRRLAIGWNAFVSMVTALVVAWQWTYRAVIRLDQWPDYVATDLVPWFVLMVMLLPATRRAVTGQHVPGTAPSPESSQVRESSRMVFLLRFATLTLLIVVVSAFAVDALDWAIRVTSDIAGVVEP